MGVVGLLAESIEDRARRRCSFMWELENCFSMIGRTYM